MKAIKLRNVLLLILVALFSVCCIGTLLSTNTANAQTVTFEMVEGAQFGLTRDGIRFVVKMDESVYDKVVTNDAEDKVKLSVYVAPIQFFNALEGENAGRYDLLAKKVEIKIDEQKIYTNQGYYYANALIANLNAENNPALNGVSQFKYQFVGVGVIIDNTNEQTEYTFASFHNNDIANNTRSQYDMLQNVILSDAYPDLVEVILSETSPYKWFGTENYPIEIDNADEYNSLVGQINAGFDLSDFNIKMFSGIDKESCNQLDGDKSLPANINYYHQVSFYNGEELLTTGMALDNGTIEYNGEVPQKESDGFYTYEFANAWVDENGDDVDLTNVSATQNVYAKFDKVSPRTGDDKNTVFFFNDEKGLTQLSKVSGGNVAEFIVENGMTKLSLLLLTSTGGSAVVKYDLKDYAFNSGDYVIFDIYLEVTESAEGVTDANKYIDFRFSSDEGIFGTRVKNSGYAQVLVPASVLTEGAGNFYMYGAKFNANLYMGKAIAIPASEVKDIAFAGDETTYSLNGKDYVGGTYATASGTLGTTSYEVSYSSLGGVATGAAGWSANGIVYNTASDVVPYYVNGAIRFYIRSDKYSAPRIVLKLASPVTFKSGVITITARGVDLNGCNVYLRNSSNSSYAGQKVFGEGVDVGNGYKTFTLTTTFNSSWASESYDYLIIQVKSASAGIYSQAIISSVVLP